MRAKSTTGTHIPAKPGKSDVLLGKDSSLRKLMRAARRSLLPDENLRAIRDASTEKALKRHPWYRKKLYWDAMRARLGQT